MLESDIGVLLHNSPALSVTDQMALFLVSESVKARSIWKPYIDALPLAFTTPIYFSDAELALLKGTALSGFVRNRKERIEQVYRENLLPLCADNKDEFPVCFSVEKFKWALSVLWSRCFTVNIDGEEQGALVPLGD